MTMQVHTDTIKRRYNVTRTTGNGSRFNLGHSPGWLIRHERGCRTIGLSDYLALTFQNALEVIDRWNCESVQ